MNQSSRTIFLFKKKNRKMKRLSDHRGLGPSYGPLNKIVMVAAALFEKEQQHRH